MVQWQPQKVFLGSVYISFLCEFWHEPALVSILISEPCVAPLAGTLEQGSIKVSECFLYPQEFSDQPKSINHPSGLSDILPELLADENPHHYDIPLMQPRFSCHQIS